MLEPLQFRADELDAQKRLFRAALRERHTPFRSMCQTRRVDHLGESEKTAVPPHGAAVRQIGEAGKRRHQKRVFRIYRIGNHAYLTIMS